VGLALVALICGTHRARGAALALACTTLGAAAPSAHAAGTAPPAAACSPAAEAPALVRCLDGLPGQALLPLLQRQRASRWCWAAALSMALHAHGVAAAQEDLVRLWFGAAVNEGLAPGQLLQLAARRWTDAQGQPVLLAASALPTGRAGLLAPEVRQDLAAGLLPLVALPGHLVVLTELLWERQPDGSTRLLRAVVADPGLPDVLRNLRGDELPAATVLRLQARGPGGAAAGAAAVD
jgi:hypothetical protein